MCSADKGKTGVLCPEWWNPTLAIDSGQTEWGKRQKRRGSPYISITKDDTRSMARSVGTPWGHWVHSSRWLPWVWTPAAPILHLVNLCVKRNPRRKCKGWLLPGSWRNGCLTPKLLESCCTQVISLHGQNRSQQGPWMSTHVALISKKIQSK